VLALAPNAAASALTDLVRDCNGVVAIEFLIMLGPLLLLLLGTFDIGLMTLSETRINFAVEAAAKCGAIGAAMCISPSQTAAGAPTRLRTVSSKGALRKAPQPTSLNPRRTAGSGDRGFESRSLQRRVHCEAR
jgi:hypothetical protein